MTTFLCGDAVEKLREMPDESVDCCITSPPYYGLRDYGRDGQIGLEDSPETYIERLVEVFREVKRVLKPEGTLWLNIADSYAGSGKGAAQYPDNAAKYKQGTNKGMVGAIKTTMIKTPGIKRKDLIGIPWMLAFALRADGWYLRQDIIWCISGGMNVYVKSQKGVMPMTVKDLTRLDPKKVQLWNGSSWVNVLGYGKSNDTSEKIEIVLRSGERISATGNHKWVLSNGKEVRTSELQVGDVLKTCLLPDCGEHNPTFLTEGVLWLLGLYVAEGSRSDDCIQLALNADEAAWLPAIKDAVTHLGGTMTFTKDGNCLNVRIYSRVLLATLHQYIGGHTAKDKHLNNICWSLPNNSLRWIVKGYLDGDGHYEQDTKRVRLGFTRNYYLERDLRIAAARLGAKLTLNPSNAKCNGKSFPSFRGEWRWEASGHFNEKERSEIVKIGKSKAREFYDISVDCDNHLFSLASGVLTHNCKPNPMPESVTDRCTKSHEYIFLLAKSQKYYFDSEAIAEPVADSTINRLAQDIESQKGSDRVPGKTNGNMKAVAPRFGGDRPRHKNLQDKGLTTHSMHERRAEGFPDQQYAMRNKRDVWTVSAKPYKEAHFATFPKDLIEPCVLAGCPEGGTVLDPFLGSGTTAVVAEEHRRNAIGIDLNAEYIRIAQERVYQATKQQTFF